MQLTHLPPKQIGAVAGQVVPHWPQLFGSVLWSTQLPLQQLKPEQQAGVELQAAPAPPQAGTQTPPVQIPLQHWAALLQLLPFARQLTHWPPTQFWPAGQQKELAVVPQI